ncbi:MAG: YicC family protein [Alphaproteobacteria bacterium]|nr:YicC family protein [Alphaproteobacteria bacterium]
MTGFASAFGTLGPSRWSWELKTVNAKGLDLRLRLPPGLDVIEVEARKRITSRLARGTCYANLTLHRELAQAEVRINQPALTALIQALENVPATTTLRPASFDGLLQVRGIVDVIEASDTEEQKAALTKAALTGLDQALDQLITMRSAEGAALHAIIATRIETIAQLTQAAEQTPGRTPAAVMARLRQSVEALSSKHGLDEARLYQEALILAAKADIREELDRLKAHVEAARDLIAQDQPIGRKLDFLAQEFAREANTLCAKSNDAQLTALGMDLRVEIEQLREQVQNIE